MTPVLWQENPQEENPLCPHTITPSKHRSLIDHKCSLPIKSNLSVTMGSQLPNCLGSHWGNSWQEPTSSWQVQSPILIAKKCSTMATRVSEFILRMAVTVQSPQPTHRKPGKCCVAWLLSSHSRMGVDIFSQTTTQKNKASSLLFVRLLIVSIIVYNHNVVMIWCSMH